MSGRAGRCRTGRAARAQRRDLAAHRAEHERQQSGLESGPRQALTHRMTGLADHPLAQGLAEPIERTAPEPEPTVAVVRCTERSDRGGSIGPCGGLHVEGQPCPRRGVHVDRRDDEAGS